MLARWVLRVSKESKVRQAKLARPEQLALKVPLALMARRVRKVTSDLWVCKVLKAILAQWARPAQQVLTARKVRKGTLAQWDRKVFRDYKVKLALQARPERMVRKVTSDQ